MRVDCEKIIRLTKAGVSRKIIAEMMKISVRTVTNALRPVGLLDKKRVEGGRKGNERLLK